MRSSACAAASAAAPGTPFPFKDRACRGTHSRVFQECLSLLADRRTYDFFFLASKKLLASSWTCPARKCLSPPNPAKEQTLTLLPRFTSAAGRGLPTVERSSSGHAPTRCGV